MKLRFHLENNIMKIKFKNGSYLESIESADFERSSRADKLYDFIRSILIFFLKIILILNCWITKDLLLTRMETA